MPPKGPSRSFPTIDGSLKPPYRLAAGLEAGRHRSTVSGGFEVPSGRKWPRPARVGRHSHHERVGDRRFRDPVLLKRHHHGQRDVRSTCSVIRIRR